MVAASAAPGPAAAHAAPAHAAAALAAALAATALALAATALAPSAFLLRSTRSPPLDPVRERRVPIRRADECDARDVLGY